MSVTEPNHVLFEELAMHVRNDLRHPYLEANRVRQQVSRFHFDVSWGILRAANVSEPKSKRIVEAVLLLHAGLSIHDTVEEHTDVRRELSVLAGDYDSSRYYWLLSSLGDDDLLSSLSEAVVRINEAKVMLFPQYANVTPDQFMSLQETIQGELLFALTSHFLQPFDLWLPEIRALVRAFVVQEEIRTRRHPVHFTLRQASEWLSDAVDNMIHGPANTLIEPVASFLTEYLVPIKNMLEKRAYAEGNR